MPLYNQKAQLLEVEYLKDLPVGALADLLDDVVLEPEVELDGFPFFRAVETVRLLHRILTIDRT